MIRTIRSNSPSPNMIRTIRRQGSCLGRPRTGHYHGCRERQYNA
ncbi:hypothetical protein ACQKP7_02795 [Pseudomonas frederiksbergensis]